ncbi:MAG: flavodoxin-dependent (E)-4-hydroxy-3-methylbut-2-enyl-diphosphate synthase [Nitrospinota bacterium]
MALKRRKTKCIYVGAVGIGCDNPISVQSMTNTDTRDVSATVRQVLKLEEAGCEIVRVAVPDMAAARAIKKIKTKIGVPLIADIHFDYRLALESMEGGADCLRINPGNIGARWKVHEVVRSALQKNISIRIGVNAGSLDQALITRHNGPTPAAMVESALSMIRELEEMNFFEIKISLKASDILRTVEAYDLLSEKVEYPFHIGISEAGTEFPGTVKSSVGLGLLLARGLGDTMRVSLTGDPVREVAVAYEILKALNIRRETPEIISCPTCGRCEIDLEKLAGDVTKLTRNMKSGMKIAVMGCVVNGPGEAQEADLGIAGGKGVGLLFKDGKILKKVREEELLRALEEELKRRNKKGRER